MRFEFTDLELRVIYYALKGLPPGIQLSDTTTQEFDAAVGNAMLKIKPAYLQALQRVQKQPGEVTGDA